MYKIQEIGMKRLAFFFAIVLVFSCGLANAQPPGNVFTRLGTVTPTVGTDSITAGVMVSFPIIYGNRDTARYNPSNGYIIYSDADGVPGDGTPGTRGTGTATWAHATGDGGNYKGFSPDVFGLWIDTTGFYHHGLNTDFVSVFKFNCFGCDGSGADTVAFAGAGGLDGDGNPSRAARGQDSGVFFVIKILTKLADHGKYICIDSTAKFPPTNTWKWASFNYQPAYNAFPAWSGAKCFMVVDPAASDVRESGDGSLPDKFDLAQNYPNPFNPNTKIRFDLPKKSSVKLTVYNVLGQRVSTLFDGEKPAGKYEADWDGTSQTGVKVSSGMYFYKLEADGFVATKKMLLVK